MTNVILLHGRNCTTELFWYSYIKKNCMEKKNYEVWAPELPNNSEAKLEEWLPFILKNGKFNEETIIIGHSAGATVILSVLENLNIKIKQAILVAGFVELKGSNITKKDYEWAKIKNNVKEIIFINSNNDPYGCTDVQGKKMFDNLGGKLIILDGEGHMGSISYDQPYKEFPFLLNLIK